VRPDRPALALTPAQRHPALDDLTTGYKVLPASSEVRGYLSEAARKFSVALDGVQLSASAQAEADTTP
jgi:hypothetical protein